MITDKDVNKLKTIFSTKEELEELDIRTAKGFADTQKQISELSSQIADLDKKFVTKDEFVTFEDHILGEIRTLFQENLVNSSHKREINDHEARITKVEKAVFSN